MKVVPSWGGSMFEALMPALFVPEDRWAPKSWGENHPLTVRAQIYHGLRRPATATGASRPSNIPEGGYAVYGVDGIGTDSGGDPSGDNKTRIDHGWEGCPGRPALPDPPQSAYTNGVVTPHAAFLGAALRAARDARQPAPARARLPRPVRQVGLQDSVNVDSGVRLGGLPVAGPGDDHGRALATRSATTCCGARSPTASSSARVRPVIGIEKFATSG